MSRLLMIHCGGTLAMVKGPNGYATEPGNLVKLIRSSPNISSQFLSRSEKDSTRSGNDLDTFTTPSLRNGIVAIVDILEFPEIIDSSNASITDFCSVADSVVHFYDSYDAFVIIYGTDTMSYAASFPCFMIDGLGVPVIFTGSMLPMVVEGSGGERNLIGAIESCFLVDSPGVYIYFNGWLHHGARTTKICSSDAFYSANPTRIEDLAKNGTKYVSSRGQKNFTPILHSSMSNEVGIFKVFPSIKFDHLRDTLYSYKAVILETYGSGTFPSNRSELLGALRIYIAKGGVVVSVSQCVGGDVNDDYEASYELSRLGVLSAKNITTEAAFAKLSLLVANCPNEIRKWFSESICGEIDESADTKMLHFNNSRNSIKN